MTAVPPEETDAALVARARSGEASAFAALVRRHRAPVFRFARRLLGDAAQAEDVLQDTFVTAHAALADWRGTGTVRGWLLAIARSKALMARRRHAGEPEAFESVDTLEELGARAGHGHPLTPEELAERQEQRTLLERALEGLPPAEREVVLLRDVEGVSGEETAEVLGLPLATMKSRLHRGRLRLLALLREGATS